MNLESLIPYLIGILIIHHITFTFLVIRYLRISNENLKKNHDEIIEQLVHNDRGSSQNTQKLMEHLSQRMGK
jgi:hypothetical protein